MIGRDDVEKVADLARLDLTDREVDRLADDLAVVLRHFEAVQELEELERPAELTPPTEPPGPRDDHPVPMRLDVAPSDLAPVWLEGFFLVPRVPALQDSADSPRSPEP